MLKPKSIIIILWSIFIIFLILFAAVIVLLPPNSAINLLLVYSSMLISSFALFALIGFYLRIKFGIREWVNHHMVLSLRQGFWLAIILTVSMFLLSQNWFTWLNASFLILALVFFESYLLTKND